MYAVTAEEMREIDKAAVNDYLIPEDILMENAALSMLYAIKQDWGSPVFKRAAVFCKGGNNGGDGAALARHLKCEGADAAVYFIGDISKASKLTSENIKRAEKYGVKITHLKDKTDIEKIKEEVIFSDFVVDALIG
ncbi:MAG TPA: hypothetical protein ENN43_07190, partial [bacterium]|nr:hypothetical protein [bacterium]